MTTPDAQIQDAMREHDAGAPEGELIVAAVLRHRHTKAVGRRPWALPLVAVGLTAASVATVFAVAQFAVRFDRVAGPQGSTAARASQSPSLPPAQAPGALLDPLTYQLVLDRPNARGVVFSTLRVENRSTQTITDSACRYLSNFAFGVVARDASQSRLSGRQVTYCKGGVVELPPGFNGVYEGPTFSTRGLRTGTYLAVIDFGDARTERLTATLRIGDAR